MAARCFYADSGPGKLPALSLLMAMVLTACAGEPLSIQHIQKVVEDARVIAADQVEADPTEEDGENSDKLGGEGEAKEEENIPEETAGLPVDLTNFKDRLLGLNNDDLSDLLGAPSLKREEPPAMFWQYRTQVCVVDVFLYADGAEIQVDHVEARGRVSDEVDEPACFAAIIKDKDKPKPAPEARQNPRRRQAKNNGA